MTQTTTTPATFSVFAVPPRGLKKRPLFEVRDERGVMHLTCESRPHAERWAARLTK